MTNSSLAFHATQFEIIERAGQVWLQAAQIAKALAYKKDDAITQIYERNKDEFPSSMTETLKLSVSGNYQKTVRIFSLRGAHLIAMFARTPVAKEFRKWVLDVLDKEVGQNNPQTISQNPHLYLRDTIQAVAKGDRGMYKALYNRLYRKFQVTSYKELNDTQCIEAAEFIKSVEGEYIAKQQPQYNQLALSDGQHYVVAKDGVVIYHKVLSDRIAKKYLSDITKQEEPNNLSLLNRDTTNKVMDYIASLHDEINRLGGTTPSYPPFNIETIVRAVVTTMVDRSRMLLSFNTSTGQPSISFIPQDCWVVTSDNIANIVGSSDGVPKKLLPDIAKAAVNRLSGN
ncbi:Bro-N domain-containing protein [Agitococcus lubricus]|uniref:ORF6C domain-containing protein n=1 Tax=Agitococcus lubricus TaxID=1077255 RepID=A0A2T5ISG3_9GAMM|nr:BRO family protein [Agitococcus lubricus]PTQ86799.1 ORF6C domain-containing protein [Agitococcus lubricus]